MEKNINERYSRQMLLPGFGIEKQELLLKARVLVIGAGGLGCPALLYLAAAGVGHLGIIEDDKVEISNLHRQVLYGPQDVGHLKAEVAAQKIRTSYPETQVTIFPIRLTPNNALDILEPWNVVLDGSDNFPTRYLVNDACVLLQKPLVYGSVYRYEGQVAVFNLKKPNQEKTSTNYRDLFPTPPPPDQIPNCAEAGVLGVLPGIIGNLMTNEVLKIITGMGEPLQNRLLTFNSLQGSFLEFETSPNAEASNLMPKNKEALRNTNYDLACGMASPGPVKEVNQLQFKELARSSKALVLDVRYAEEEPKIKGLDVLSIPLPELENRLGELKSANPVLVLCQSGIRSKKAAQTILSAYKNKQVYSLRGGMNGWDSNS